MNKALNILGVAAVATLLSTSADATIFQIDSFSVFKNGSLLFEDNFDDGIVPPGDVYSTVGLPGPEAGGKLALDTSPGFAKPSEVTGTPLLVQRSRLLTNTDNDSNRGLKVQHDIAVFGVFDLIAPEYNIERYGIRLTDFKTDYPSNDNVGIDVRRNAAGELAVAFREADFDLGIMNILDQFLLTEEHFLNYEQIGLGLFSGAGSQQVFGGFSLLGSGGNTDFQYFDGFGNIFEGENWTRAAFIASRPIESIPEPWPLALLLPVLAWMGLLGVRKTR